MSKPKEFLFNDLVEVQVEPGEPWEPADYQQAYKKDRSRQFWHVVLLHRRRWLDSMTGEWLTSISARTNPRAYKTRYACVPARRIQKVES